MHSAVGGNIWGSWLIHLDIAGNSVTLSEFMVAGALFFPNIFHLEIVKTFSCIQGLNRGSNQNCSCCADFQLISFYRSLYPRGNSRCHVGTILFSFSPCSLWHGCMFLFSLFPFLPLKLRKEKKIIYRVT